MALANRWPHYYLKRSSGEGVLVYGKKEDLWLSLITRGMTTQPHAKRTSRIVSFLMVIGIRRSSFFSKFHTLMNFMLFMVNPLFQNSPIPKFRAKVDPRKEAPREDDGCGVEG